MSPSIAFLSLLSRWSGLAVAAVGLTACTAQSTVNEDNSQQAERPNIIFVLVDDLRYDALGFLNPVLETPNIDRLASEGAYLPNAYVTTSLCSPSRASILTGRYMKDHGVVDNNAPLAEGSVLFPSYLQEAGYETAMIGKWHMGGEVDDPQPGFDYWLSFKGQGEYFPGDNPARESLFNINGRHVPQRGYITDELTDYALDWMKQQARADQPFFLYLSHKAVHADFKPAPRHADLYRDVDIPLPETMADDPRYYEDKPRWVRDQRNTWHGVDFPYHSEVDLAEYLRRYYATIAGVDESMGRIMSFLKDEGLDENTIILFMGDNGFLFGEFGLIDKRHAYEPSMRVPLLVRASGRIAPGSTVEEVVANIDIAPTILDFSGLDAERRDFAGMSFSGLLAGEEAARWRDELLYEYYWEFNYPHTPTTFAIRTERYKYIQYHGLYDLDELYDLADDPGERKNLIFDRELIGTVSDLRSRLYGLLANEQGAHVVPYTEKVSSGAVFRSPSGSLRAEFPEEWLRTEDAPDIDQHFVPDGPGKYEVLKKGVRD